MPSLIRSSVVLILIPLLSACVLSRDAYKSVDAPIYFSYDPVDQTHAYVLYAEQPLSYMSEVQYLVNLVRFTDVTFWRNGTIYRGDQAAQWLDYKIGRFRDEIVSTEDFIDKVGSHSRHSGKDYLVVQKGRRYPIRDVFYRELERLRSHQLHATREKIVEVTPDNTLVETPVTAPQAVPVVPDMVRV